VAHSTSTRGQVITDLAKHVGFPFSESELSPALRRRVGQLETVYDDYWNRLGRGAKLRETWNNYVLSSVILLVMGLLFMAFALYVWPIILGVIFLSSAILVYYNALSRKPRLDANSSEILQLTNQAKVERSSLSRDIFSELSSTHAARLAGETNGAPGQVVKEIVKEIVMIPCHYCNSLMPQTSIICPNCGARPKA
jgi:ABC-type bacteriocin/lantibiotic exporter with double-glycine peptidase domain